MSYTDQQLSEDIYDWIKICALPDNQNDEWAKLNRAHAEDCKKNLRKFLKNKTIQWSPNEIKIGAHITITIQVK